MHILFAMNFTRRRRGGGRRVLIREDLDSSFPFAHCYSRATLPHRLLHCSVGQSRLRLRELAASRVALVRSRLTDETVRLGRIRTSSLPSRRPSIAGDRESTKREVETMQEEWRERGGRKRERAHHEKQRKGRRIRERSLRVDSTYEVKCETGGKNQDIYKRLSRASYRNVHSVFVYLLGNAK